LLIPTLLLCFIFGSLALHAQDASLDANRSRNPVIEKKVAEVLDRMTLEEKVAMCLGAGSMDFRGVPRLGIPNMLCDDGPRGPHGGFTTAFPAGVAFGATWNPELIEKAAKVMGDEARALGVSMLLGPGLNIQRDPLGGRFFEYYTEDPCLNSQLAVAFVKGVQSRDVACCIKHFVCNNREDNRNEYMSMVDERTLNEIYFPGFKAAVQEGDAWAVMTAANGLNGNYCSDSKYLLNDTLKEKWGFDGMVITDWLGTRSTGKAAFAGLDVAMPYSADSKFGAPLFNAVREGKVPEAIVDDKARRVLRTMARVGLLDGIAPTSGGVLNTREHFKMSEHVAEESLVLLKNEKHTLPLDIARIRKVVVVGPNADQRFCVPGLGGSSWVSSPYEITPLQGVRNILGTNACVQYFSSEDLGDFKIIPQSVMQEQNGQKGFLAKYYNVEDSNPAVERIEPELNFVWEMRSPDLERVKPGQFRAQFVGSILPPTTGSYTLRLTSGADSAYVFGDRESGTPLAFTDSKKGISSAVATVQMQAGKPFFIRVEYSKASGDGLCRLEWRLPMDEEKNARLMAAAKGADAVLVFAGINHSLDTEGQDRTSMKFPNAQQALILQLTAANPKTIVTLINGSPLELSGWIHQVPAVLEAWYPGMEGGTAIANVLFGRVNPSGKLPFTWPKRLEDSPAYAVGSQNNDRVDYKEGIFVGYRYFDTRHIEPQFPFGYGLSYTTFDYQNLKVTQTNDIVFATVTIKNSGKVAGAETIQLYVREIKPVVPRPVHELKAFKKIQLAPGETGEISFVLGRGAFSYFSTASDNGELHSGKFEIQAGDSSRDIRQRGTIFIPPPAPIEASVGAPFKIPYYSGADGGGRTHTTVRSLDFESSASASSATSATNSRSIAKNRLKI
jgi:beta-glucosidase